MSHYLRCLELAKQYPNSEILFSSSLKYSNYIEKEGYNTFYVEDFDPDVVMECAAKFDFSWLNFKDIQRVFLSQVEVIKELKPDLVIGDTSPTLKMAAEFTGVPYVALMNGYMSKHYKNVRALSKTHPGNVHLSKLPPKVSKQIIKFAEAISFRIVHKPFKKVRRMYELKRVSNYINEMEGDENMICDHEYLFPQNNLPSHYKIIGPLMYKTFREESELLSQIDPNKKTICVCMGSSGNWEKLSFLSSNKYSEYNIITAGDLQKKISGDHVINKDFIALESVLPHCALLICHGGNGTIYHGIENKIPTLCLTNHFEQEWNVQQLEALKLGICIDDDPEEKIDTYLKTKQAARN
jgi:UDP:flavonoid glycosyltransferase YjiC (YdhE family)